MLILLVASLGSAGLPGDGDAPGTSDVTLVPEDEVSVQDDGDVPVADGDAGPSGGASRATTITTLTTLCNASGTDDGDQYGFAVSMGDIDGDGLSDVVASAPLASVGAEPNAGRVYIHWGEQMLASAGVSPSTAQTTLLGESAQANFGWSMSQVKDVDGDDLGDLLVGSPGYASSTGRASLFKGSEMDDEGEVDAAIAFDGGTAGDQYGWSVAFAGDVDGDGEVDAIIGAPGADRAYLYFGPAYDPGDRIIMTGSSNSDFGHCVAGAGDINNDGFDDLAIGAPSGNDGTGEVKLVFGYDGIEAGGNIRKFNNTLNGESVGDQFGYSVVSGKLDSDKKGDLLIGGPGADRAFIYYGKDIGEAELIPYLWHWPGDAKTPIGFQSGVYNDVGASQDVNTYGLGAGDDGWDWNLHTFGSSYSMSAVYGGTEGDGYGTTLDGSTRLEAIAGPTHTAPGYSGWWGRSDSASWGLEFTITQDMYDGISGGGAVTLGFDWEAQDTSVVSGLGSTPGGGTEEPCYVKARFSSASDTVFLGEDLGGDTGPDILYATGSNQAPWGSPQPYNDSFSQDVTEYVTGAGSYYLEMGVLLDGDGGRLGEAEGIIAYFDDIWVKVRTGAPDFASKIIGTAGTMFGGAVSLVGDLDDDGKDEICVGSPNDGKGSLGIFSTQTSLGSTVYSTSADIRNTGGVSGEDFAWSVAGAGDLNGDGLNDIIAGSPRKKSSSGFLTVLTPNQIPSISWVEPGGGDVLKGKVSLKVHCADEEDGSDIHDVGYWYMEEDEDGDYDPDTLTLIGYHSDSGTDSGNVYSMKWNTKPLADANYYLVAWVTDTVGLDSFAISDKISVNNPDSPVIELIYPHPEFSDIKITGEKKLIAKATDLDDDIRRVYFYSTPYTDDGTRADLTNWTLISSDSIPNQEDEYNVTWSTRMVVDGQYLVMAVASDKTGLEAEAVSLPVLVNNPDPPRARVTYPSGGEILSGTVTIEAKVTDADNNVVSDGVLFSVTQDELKLNWTDLGVGEEVLGEDDRYSISWDTTTGDYPDGVYWARVRGADQTGTVTYDSSESFSIDNPTGPSVEVEQVPETVTGSIRLKATIIDPDSGLSDEGVRFYWGLYTGAASDLRSRDGDVRWKLVGTALDSDTLLGSTYSAVWDTTAEGVADGTEYYVKAWVKDSTLLEASGYSGKFEVNNPDPPQIFMDIKEGHLKGTVYLNATVDDPDGPDDIDDDHHRGVSFFYSTDNITWHFIGNDEERDNATETPFYSWAWDTSYLEDEEVTIKAMVVDKTGLMAEDYEEGRTVRNLRMVPEPIVKEGQGESFLWLFLILLILIIVVSVAIAAISYKKAARRRKLREAAEKEEAVQRAKMELLRDFPVSGTPYSDMLAAAAAGQMPMMLGTGAPMGAAGAPGQPQLLLPAGTSIPVAGSADAPADISGMEAAGAGPYAVAAAQMQGAQAQPGVPGQPGAPLQTQQGVMPMGGVGQQMYVMPQNPYAVAQQMYMQMQMQQMAQNMGVSPPASGQTIDVSQPQAPAQAAAPQQPATQPATQQPAAGPVAPAPQTPATAAPGAPVTVTPAPGPTAPGTPPKKPTEGGGA